MWTVIEDKAQEPDPERTAHLPRLAFIPLPPYEAIMFYRHTYDQDPHQSERFTLTTVPVTEGEMSEASESWRNGQRLASFSAREDVHVFQYLNASREAESAEECEGCKGFPPIEGVARMDYKQRRLVELQAKVEKLQAEIAELEQEGE